MNPCMLCGREKLASRDIETREQLKQITRRINELENTKNEYNTLKLALESKINRGDDSRSVLKEKYLQLLQQKEIAQQRLHKMKAMADGTAYSADSLQVVVDKETETLRDTVETTKHMREILQEQSQELFYLRMVSALRIFKMMNVDVQLPARKQNKPDSKGSISANAELSGCGSIMSLPLPNSGNYSGVPLDVLTPAIAHVVHLVDALSATLNIPLPHELYPFESSDCMVSAQHDLWARATVRSACYSLCPATHMNDRTKFRDFDWTSLRDLPPHPSQGNEHHKVTVKSPQVPAKDLTSGISGGGGDAHIAVEYAANPNFPGALVLLQADVVALCVHTGIPAEQLWPPEAMLFNLHLLHKHCAAAVRDQERYYGTVDDCVPAACIPVAELTDPDVQRVHNEAALYSVLDRYGSAAAVREQQRIAHSVAVEDNLMEDGDDGVLVRSEFPADAEWNMVNGGLHNVPSR